MKINLKSTLQNNVTLNNIHNIADVMGSSQGLLCPHLKNKLK